jgi:oligopeptidase A
MLAARNFQSGMQMLRQVEFSLFDLLLHSDFDPAGERSVLDLLAEVRREVAVLVPPHGTASRTASRTSLPAATAPATTATSGPRSFRPTVTALSKRPATHSTGGPDERFLSEILSVGGSRPAIDSFRAFRGREPQVDALLRHSGMVAA